MSRGSVGLQFRQPAWRLPHQKPAWRELFLGDPITELVPHDEGDCVPSGEPAPAGGLQTRQPHPAGRPGTRSQGPPCRASGEDSWHLWPGLCSRLIGGQCLPAPGPPDPPSVATGSRPAPALRLPDTSSRPQAAPCHLSPQVGGHGASRMGEPVLAPGPRATGVCGRDGAHVPDAI